MIGAPVLLGCPSRQRSALRRLSAARRRDQYPARAGVL